MSHQFYQSLRNDTWRPLLSVSAEREPFDGDSRMFRLGIEANQLGLAYEYDPFFSLSTASPTGDCILVLSQVTANKIFAGR